MTPLRIRRLSDGVTGEVREVGKRSILVRFSDGSRQWLASGKYEYVTEGDEQ